MKKNKPKYTQKVALDMYQLMLDPSSDIHCDKCQERMGIFHTLRYALFKKKGSEYFVPCKNCGYANPRTKGEYGDSIKSKWREFEYFVDEQNESRK